MNISSILNTGAKRIFLNLQSNCLRPDLDTGQFFYTTTLYVMVDIVKGGGRAPPPPAHPLWANFSIMMEYTPENGKANWREVARFSFFLYHISYHISLCTLYSVQARMEWGGIRWDIPTFFRLLIFCYYCVIKYMLFNVNTLKCTKIFWFSPSHLPR
jgi:hypothetical protein